MQKKQKIQIAVMAFLFLVVTTGFIIFLLQDRESSSKKLLITEVSSNSLNVPYGKPGLTFQLLESWTQGSDKDCPTQHFGAKYEAQLYNYDSINMSTWTMTVEFPADTVIDSSWNASFSTQKSEDGKKTIITISVLDSNNTKFGMVVHTRVRTFEIKNVEFWAYNESVATDSPLYWIFIVAYSIMIFLTLLQIIIAFKLKSYRSQKIHDELLIDQAINTFVNFIDAKDPYTKGHSTRVALYSREIAQHLGLSEEEQKNLYFIALMHDVGKISIPDSVLQKPGRLTPEERKIIESHTSIGGTMLRDFNALPGIVSGALYHHERFDGTGYPQGLAGEDIPLFARIICVADSYDAMSSRRCYRSKLSIDEILRELRTNSGKQFDPKIVYIMVDILEDAKANGKLAQYNL